MGSKNVSISDRFLGIMIIVGLFLQFVLPYAGIRSLSSIGVLIYIIVALYLIFLA